MRGHLPVLVAVVFTVACVPSRGQFRLEYPGRELVDPVAITITDRTGLIAGVAVAPPDIPGREGEVTVKPGEPAVLIVTWVGGMCDQTTELVFERTATGFRFVEHTERADACLLAAIGRSLAIRLSTPIAPETVEFVAAL